MFAEERDDLPQEPEGSRPEDEETPAAPPGESGDATPTESDSDAIGPEIGGAEELAAAGEEPPGDAPEQPAAEGDEPQPEGHPRRSARGGDASEEEVIPGMHLEPDLVLEEAAREETEFGQYVEDETYAEVETREDPGPGSRG
jgi:hypothetical protein